MLAITLVSLALAEFGRRGGVPEKPISVVVLFAVGGPTDVVASYSGASDERPQRHAGGRKRGGAGGTIGAGKVIAAAGDGYTPLFHHIGMSTALALYRKLSDFKPLDDCILSARWLTYR